jgi:hypothetical protein
MRLSLTVESAKVAFTTLEAVAHCEGLRWLRFV